MNWYKIAKNDFLDMFGEDYVKRNIIKKDPPYYDLVTLTLYRGFDADINQLKKVGNQYVLSPAKSEQGLIWFSQNSTYATGRGDYLLEYPLSEVKRYKQKVYYDDGTTSETLPLEILDKSCPTENCQFWGGYELPDGWFFSYKTEKHIVCNKEILVSSDMIKKEEDHHELV